MNLIYLSSSEISKYNASVIIEWYRLLWAVKKSWEKYSKEIWMMKLEKNIIQLSSFTKKVIGNWVNNCNHNLISV